MWTEITSTYQLDGLRKDDEILHHPADGGQKLGSPSGKEINSRIYRVHSIDDDLIVLYSTADKGDGVSYYASTGIELSSMLNGRWWIKSSSTG